MLKLAESLDAVVGHSAKGWVILPPESLKPKTRALDLKNSGTALALAASILSLSRASVVLTGDAALRSRSMASLMGLLQKLGAEVHSVSPLNAPPLVVFGGGLRGGILSPSAAEARYLPAVLVPSPFAESEVRITLPERDSRVFLQPALEVMESAGAAFSSSKRTIRVHKCRYRSFNYRVRRELSASAPFLLASLLTRGEAEVRLQNLSERDGLFLRFLAKYGVLVEKRHHHIRLSAGRLRGCTLNLSSFPELLPFFAVLAAFARGTTRLTGAQEARNMKSDRIAAMAAGLKRLGVKVLERADGLVVKGPNQPREAEVDGANDYAVSAALVVAALKAKGEIKVKNALEALKRCFPNFVRTFRAMGADISIALR
jgi:3-phosphoshikimate 1-carboxyvinyltransferase